MARLTKAKSHPEDDLQIQVAEWLEVVLDPEQARFTHIPNGGYRRPMEAARLKRMGVHAGWSDVVILWGDGRIGFIELKIKPNRTSKEQKDFLAFCEARGIHHAVCYSFDEVMDTVAAWGVPTRMKSLF